MMRWLRGIALFCSCLWLTSSGWAQPLEGFKAALQTALQNHPSITGKQAEVAASGFSGDSARAQRYPSVTASAQRYAASADATNLLTSPTTLRVRQPLWAFGRIDANIAYADGVALVDQLDLVRVQRQLLDATAVAYARVLVAQQRVQVSVDNVNRHADLLSQIRRRETGQVASVADVNLAHARWLQAVAQKNRYESELQQAVDELVAQTQLPVTVIAITTPDVFASATLDVLQEQAASQSADILLKKQKWEVAKLAVDQARLSPLPTVYMQGDRVPAYVTTGSTLNRYSVVLEANLDGGGFVALGKVKEAAARAQAAEEDVRNANNEMLRSLRSFVSNRDLSQNLMHQQKDAVAQLEILWASYKRQYEAGTKAWLDVLNMQRELSDQRLQGIQAYADWMTYALRLNVLVGQLDEFAGLSKD